MLGILFLYTLVIVVTVSGGQDSYWNLDSSHSLLPPLWSDVPELNRHNFPTSKDGALIVDAWDYLQRMSLYKYMIENFNNCAWEVPNKIESSYLNKTDTKTNPNSIIWGLPLQHGWQYSSGRLFDPTVARGNLSSTTIDPGAWWACMK
jgi:hypothetical protein